MNINHALGFLVLGLLMHTTPLMAQAYAGSSAALGSSVRVMWLEFMSCVNGGIGLAFLARFGAVRLPVLAMSLVPERWLRPSEARDAHVRIPSGARIVTGQ
ncbi:MAG: hypothetical protein QM790_18935 [Nibricoccus sp.]